ncbi:MAG: bifunctional adenosylcobinamide kinase/adenosylcobinamide-phosphate guanylyltransferase [Pseudomonadota bacterium]
MKPSPLVLVLGGARSGKSRYAEALVEKAGREATYIATAGPPRDEEMEERIKSHQRRRPAQWKTVDAPTDLPGAVSQSTGTLLVDCLTLWLTNIMLNEDDIDAATQRLIEAFGRRTAPIVVVANEVGEGIVPATPLGRRFRDAQGVLNQRVAATATDVVILIAGCPLVVKPRQQQEPHL